MKAHSRSAATRMRSRCNALAAGLLLAIGLLPAHSLFAQEQGIVFRHALDNEPLDVPLPTGEKLTDAVAQFHRTGENLYEGNVGVVAEGKRVFARWCQSCHLPDATGRIGPNLVDDEYIYPRADTDVGMFEIIYGGAAGAMQAFGDRISQDDILKTIAFINSLRP